MPREQNPQHDPAPTVTFYIPERCMLADMPNTIEAYWETYESKRGRKHTGRYSWTLKTYLYLQRYGIACTLAHHLPAEGIVIAHRDFLEELSSNTHQRVLLVCIKADRDALEFADLHIVQNPTDPLFRSWEWKGRTFFIHYWPLAPILRRDPGRGACVCNIAYMGRIWHLAPQIQNPAWERALEKMGLRWMVMPPDRWNDYRLVDVVVAVRSFDSGDAFHHKPASKLVNAWHAGVPAVLGPESAYRAERRSALDYLEGASLEATLEALNDLQQRENLYQEMVENGLRRAQDFTTECIAREWERFLVDMAVPALTGKMSDVCGS